jgi:hypothetical protein
MVRTKKLIMEEYAFEDRTVIRFLLAQDHWALKGWDAFEFQKKLRPFDTIDNVYFKAMPSSNTHDMVYLVIKRTATLEDFKKDMAGIKILLDEPESV